jgi:ATP-binding cassette subfamily F protein 3
MKLDLDRDVHVGKQVVTLDRLAVGYAGQPPLLEDLDLRVEAGACAVIQGANGTGKTTLLRTIAGLLPPVSGRVRLGVTVRPGYLAQEQEQLDPDLSALETLRRAAPQGETEARSFLHFFLFEGDEPLRAVGTLSFGERARLGLALLVARQHNVLLLDEPLNHLDIPSRERFEAALARYAGTVLAVAHDRAFVERFATTLWTVEGSTIQEQVMVAA